MESILLIPLTPDTWNEEKYRDLIVKVLSYPKKDEDIGRERMDILIEEGLNAFLFEGKVVMDGLKFVGKGTNSLVVKGVLKNDIVALKILRLDASRNSLLKEAGILMHLNETGISPKIIAFSEWFIIEEFIEGTLIGEFLQDDIYSYGKKEVDLLISDILIKSYELDQLGIDHGELSRADRHLIVTSELFSVITDFESASEFRRPKNLTSICQYLFNRSHAAEYLRLLYDIKLDKLNSILRNYKKDSSHENFKMLLEYLNLQ